MPTEDLDDLLLPNLLHQINFSKFKEEWYLSPSVSPLATKGFKKSIILHPMMTFLRANSRKIIRNACTN